MRPKLPAAAAPRSLTFTLSLWLLGAIAVFQLFALTFKVVPPVGGKGAAELEEKIRGSQTSSNPGDVYRPKSEPATEAVQNAIPPQPAPQSLDTQRVQGMLLESQKFQRIGQWDQALPFLEQAVALMPQDPAVLYQYAFVLGRLQREAEALDVLDGLLASRNLDPTARAEVQKLASMLEQTQSNAKSVAPPKAPENPLDLSDPIIPNVAQNQSASALLEDGGFQPGAALGIVNVQEIALNKEDKVLRVAIKCRPDTKVDNRNAEVRVKFFEKNSAGDVVLTDSKARLEWISQPIDWKDDLPELVDAIYPLPGTKNADHNAAGNTFYGYTVGVYFNGELQDSRSEPGNLQTDFPLELFLTNK